MVSLYFVGSEVFFEGKGCFGIRKDIGFVFKSRGFFFFFGVKRRGL